MPPELPGCLLYLTWWFIGVLILFVAGWSMLLPLPVGAGAGTRKLRTRIATDLRDDIGATLSSISFYSEAVKQKIKDEVPDARPILKR